MSIPDAIGALVGFLKDDSTLNTLVGGRVYWGAIPASVPTQWGNVPQKSVVVQASAGGFGVLQRTFVQAGNSRVDIRCYGETQYEAMRVHRHVYPLLKHCERVAIPTGEDDREIVIYAVTPIIEVSSLVEPDTGWPFAFASYNVMASEIEVSV